MFVVVVYVCVCVLLCMCVFRACVLFVCVLVYIYIYICVCTCCVYHSPSLSEPKAIARFLPASKMGCPGRWTRELKPRGFRGDVTFLPIPRSLH